jgi:hypothetical protein
MLFIHCAKLGLKCKRESCPVCELLKEIIKRINRRRRGMRRWKRRRKDGDKLGFVPQNWGDPKAC